METKSQYMMVRDFHLSFGHPAPDAPVALTDKQAMNRAAWIMEEVVELLFATAGNNVRFDELFLELKEKMQSTYAKQLGKPFPDNKLVGGTDAFIDVLYFANGGLTEMGINPDPLFEIVHQANMAKLFPDGKPHYNEDGKVVKPDGWEPPESKLQEEIKRQQAM